MGAGGSTQSRKQLVTFCNFFMSEKNKHYCALLENGSFNLPPNVSKPKSMSLSDIFYWIMNLTDEDKKFFDSIKPNEQILADLRASGINLIQATPTYKLVKALYGKNTDDDFFVNTVAKILTYAENNSNTGMVGGMDSRYNNINGGMAGNINGGTEELKTIITGGGATIMNMSLINIVLIVLIIILTYHILLKLGCIVDISKICSGFSSNKESMIPYKPLIK